MISVLIVIVAGGIGLFVQIHEVKSDLHQAGGDISNALVRVGKIETTLAEIQTGQSSTTGSLSRIESRLAALRPQSPAQAPLLLISSEDAEIIRSALKFDPSVAS